MTKRFLTVLAAGFFWGQLWAGHPGQEAFVKKAVNEHGLDADRVEEILAQAQYKQSIIDAISRPAEAMPWHRYRPIFMTEERIQLGVEFWNEHQETIAAAAEEYQVDEAIIVAIIGVETKYGRITGSYRVLDALATLGFYYPKRAKFFAGELLEFILLAGEESLPIDSIKGSYAGAMGLGQFIPSSYRAYAVDFDGDESRDLWASSHDAIGSVANYFRRHHWRQGEAVLAPLQPAQSAQPMQSQGSKPASTLADLATLGYVDDSGLAGETPASLLVLEQRSGQDYWATFHNFYVITRYNRSPLYAMAVYQLSEAIKAARAAP